MLNNLINGGPTVLDETIDRVIEEMKNETPGSEDYGKLLADLERLIAMKNNTPRNYIDKDTLVIVAGNLVGILIIVGHERAHVVASRALQLLFRTKHH